MPLMPTPAVSPYTSIGQFIVRHTSGNAERTTRGTAFRVAPLYVLTAAHLLTAKDGERYEGAEVVFSLGGGTQTYQVGSARRHPLYSGESLSETIHDIAICRLEADPGNNPPALGTIGENPGRDDRRREVAGFLFRTGAQPQCVSSRVEIEPWVVNTPFLYPLHSTEQGMSGGPVLGTENGQWVVDGIIVGDDNVKCRAAPLRTTKVMNFFRVFLPCLCT